MDGQASEPKAATVGEAILGLISILIILALLFMVGSCVFGGGDEKSAQATAEATPQVESQTPSADTQTAAATSEGSASSSSDVSEAAGTVALIIGLNGYDCIKVIDTQNAGSGVYDVTCVTDHHGHQATYMVNSRNNDVAKI